MFGVPVPLAMRLISNESSGNNGAVSSKGAIGFTQLMGPTAREMGVQNIHDPNANIYGGMRYLGQMIQRYRGNIPLALAAYNGGPGALDAVGGNIARMPLETQNYVREFGF